MYNKSNLLFLILLFLSCLSGCDGAEVSSGEKEMTSKPIISKNETYEFLKKKVTFNKKDRFGTISKFSLSSKDKCLLTHALSVYPNDYYDNVQYIHKMEVNLKDVDTNEIKSYEFRGNFFIDFLIREDRKLINNIITYSDYYMNKNPNNERVSKYNSSKGSMFAKNLKDANKSVKALTHLVSLCGGKSELF